MWTYLAPVLPPLLYAAALSALWWRASHGGSGHAQATVRVMVGVWAVSMVAYSQLPVSGLLYAYGALALVGGWLVLINAEEKWQLVVAALYAANVALTVVLYGEVKFGGNWAVYGWALTITGYAQALVAAMWGGKREFRRPGAGVSGRRVFGSVDSWAMEAAPWTRARMGTHKKTGSA